MRRTQLPKLLLNLICIGCRSNTQIGIVISAHICFDHPQDEGALLVQRPSIENGRGLFKKLNPVFMTLAVYRDVDICFRGICVGRVSLLCLVDRPIHRQVAG